VDRISNVSAAMLELQWSICQIKVSARIARVTIGGYAGAATDIQREHS
jgi:hypothetical protein